MPDSILQTKLYTPVADELVVMRPRLDAQLDDALNTRLGLIQAPAGYGKTTLVARWLKGRNVPYVWLSLDNTDSDPERFMQYLIAALSGLEPTLNELEVSPEGFTPEAALTQLINSLLELTEDSVLVLDDYHSLEGDEVHALTAYLLDHLPPKLHLVMTSRSVPALPLARLRVRRQLLELSANDLRFTQDEAKAFFNDVMGFGLSDDFVQHLDAKTEGWAASLQLAALSLRNSGDKQAFIEAFSGADEFVLEYLASEVFSQQTPELQGFLLKISLLERFNAALCQAVIDNGQANDLLIEARAAQLFLVPLDVGGEWLRFHPLFADFLRRRLKATRPERVPEIYISAARWCEAQGYTYEAINYVLAGGDVEEAAKLVERTDRNLLWRHDQRGNLRLWLEALPLEVIRARPRLSLDQAWLQLGARAFDKAQRSVVDVERLLSKNDVLEETEMRAELAILKAEFAINDRAFEAGLRLLDEALTLIPKDDLLRGTALQSRGYLLHVRNDPGAEAALLEAERVCRIVGNLTLALFAGSDLAAVYQKQGNLHAATETLLRSLEYARSRATRLPTSAASALLRLADVLREQNRLKEASSYVKEGGELASRAIYQGRAHYAGIVRARLHEALGESDRADELYRVEGDAAAREGLHWRSARMKLYRARLALRLGDAATAASLLNREEAFDDRRLYSLRLLVYARQTLVKGDGETALKRLDQLKGNPGSRRKLERDLLKALAHDALGQTAEASAVLQSLLDRAGLQGYMRIFLDEGKPMADMLTRFMAGGSSSTYVLTLLKAFKQDTGSAQSEAQPSLLTRRELQILCLIAEGLSNEAIAERLIRSTGTIKSHSSSIYSKLGVKSRTEAVARARALGLLN